MPSGIVTAARRSVSASALARPAHDLAHRDGSRALPHPAGIVIAIGFSALLWSILIGLLIR